MPAHDIIDNRNEKLIDHLNEMLGSCDRARFAVGYLFLSGLPSSRQNGGNSSPAPFSIGAIQ